MPEREEENRSDCSGPELGVLCSAWPHSAAAWVRPCLQPACPLLSPWVWRLCTCSRFSAGIGSALINPVLASIFPVEAVCTPPWSSSKLHFYSFMVEEEEELEQLPLITLLSARPPLGILCVTLLPERAAVSMLGARKLRPREVVGAVQVVRLGSGGGGC